MKEPEDFWKSVAAVTVAEIILFAIVGSLIYVFVGNQYMTSPAFASLENDIFMKISFSFMVPTLIFLGVLYASVSARFIFFRMFEGTRHKANHTVIGWASWAAILLFLWTIAWVISEVIPFFTNLLSIMSAIFGSYFGFILWGFAWIRMRQAENPNLMKRQSIREWVELVFNISIICIGLLFLGPGTFVSFFFFICSGCCVADRFEHFRLRSNRLLIVIGRVGLGRLFRVLAMDYIDSDVVLVKKSTV